MAKTCQPAACLPPTPPQRAGAWARAPELTYKSPSAVPPKKRGAPIVNGARKRSFDVPEAAMLHLPCAPGELGIACRHPMAQKLLRLEAIVSIPLQALQSRPGMLETWCGTLSSG